MPLAALTVSEVSKTFPGQKALDRVGLELQPGTVHALLGENGSGKSTLIRILAGYHLPDPGGVVRVGDQDLALGSPKASAEAGLRFVHQKLAVIPELNAVENVALEAGFKRPGLIDWDAQAAYTRDLLARLDVELDVFRPLSEFRAVERSAVAIARALRGGTDAKPVSVMVFDEPTAALPAAEVEQLFKVIRGLTGSGVAVLYVSHRLEEVFEIADEVTVLRDGRSQGTRPIEGLTNESLVELIVGRELDPRWDSAQREPRRAGAPEPEVALRASGLLGERLGGISFEVRKGEIVGFAGVAGSGREELPRILVGSTETQRGEIWVDGRHLPMITPDRARDAGLVLALGNTLPHSATHEFNVRENLSLGALGRLSRTGFLYGKRERRNAEEWIKSLDVRPTDTERPYNLLSGGNQQKVILGKWLNAQPSVLVLEEPTAGVDIGARHAVYQRITDEAAAGLAVVLCSSDLEDLVSIADRVLVLRDGVIVTEVSREDLTEHNLLLAAAGGEVRSAA